ncbi:MAG: hypothetical protein HY033_10430, partial [Ignavibacteriae bacterium]|nr:hypothetical protein [Ignavibacteriota bacterium]
MYHRTICRFVCLSLLSIVLSQAVFPRQSKNYKTLTTANFQFMHEKRIKQDDVRRLGETFENQYVYYQKKFNLSYAQKPKVFILNSSDRLRSESKSRVYNDAAYADGRLYVSLPQVRGKDGQGEIARIVAQSLLSRIVLCPAWLVETYAIHAGGDYKRFGKPAQVTGSSFTDLSEDYSRIDEAGNAQQ